MGRAEQAPDPSMEEILASIRKIIAEDNPEPPPAKAGPQLAVVPSAVEDDLPEEIAAGPLGFDAAEVVGNTDDEQLLEPEALDEAPPATAATDAEPATPIAAVPLHGYARSAVKAEPPIVEQAAAARPEPAAPAAMEAVSPEHDRSEEPAAEQPVAKAEAAPSTGEGADRLLSPKADEAVQSAFDQLAHTILGQQSRTLEDLVQEMLRPMLRHWLDDNLPVLVERLVREEIERVSRGRR